MMDFTHFGFIDINPGIVTFPPPVLPDLLLDDSGNFFIDDNGNFFIADFN